MFTLVIKQEQPWPNQRWRWVWEENDIPVKTSDGFVSILACYQSAVLWAMTYGPEDMLRAVIQLKDRTP